MRISDGSSDVCSSDLPHAGIPGYDPDKAEPRAISIPARRPLRAQEIGRAAASLCSPYARHITGTNLVIDGGDWLRRDVLKIGRASCGERVCMSVSILVVPVTLKKKYILHYTLT